MSGTLPGGAPGENATRASRRTGFTDEGLHAFEQRLRIAPIGSLVYRRQRDSPAHGLLDSRAECLGNHRLEHDGIGLPLSRGGDRQPVGGGGDQHECG